MGKNKPGKEDGTGPWKESYQKKVVGKGKKKVAGKKCPKSK